MDVIVDRVAGLDVHKKTVMAAVRTPGADLAADVARELENVLRSQLIARSAEDVAGEARTVRLVNLLAETAEGRAALHNLAEDDRVMLLLFVGSVGEIRGRAMGAVAVEVTKTLAWERLAIYFG